MTFLTGVGKALETNAVIETFNLTQAVKIWLRFVTKISAGQTPIQLVCARATRKFLESHELDREEILIDNATMKKCRATFDSKAEFVNHTLSYDNERDENEQ